MNISQSRYDFISEVTHKLPGWLEDYTARRTIDLLQGQLDNRVRGPLVEIGVYQGRYFSLLLGSSLVSGEARRSRDLVLGIDTFQYCSADQVRERVGAAFPRAPEFTLLEQPST